MNGNKIKSPTPPKKSPAPAAVKPLVKERPEIELVNVKKAFQVGKNLISVLHTINIQIYPREFIIILGPSGSGKSTLLNTLLGLEPPTTGKVFIKGVDITNKTTNEISILRHNHFGIVFQKADWVGSINVLQNVSLPLAIHNVATKERISKAWERLKQVGMEDHATYHPTELSGGQQQKVSLARALINDPEIVIADEPTGNLDSVSAERVMNTFQELNEKFKKTVIMVTHNLEYVRYGSRVINIKDGTVVEGIQQLSGLNTL